jgi:hypothetical protein
MAKVKAKDYEKLDDASVSRVIKLLSSEKPITKKEACELLNISYNTSRLSKIIEEYKSKQEFIKRRREQNRGKPISDFELKEIVVYYLTGRSKSEISGILYRPVSTINNLLHKYNVPQRGNGKGDYHKPELIPDESTSENFEVGELVWSARYNAVAEIISLFQTHDFHGNVYGIWVFGKHNQRAFQPWYELGKLEIVKRLGISVSDIQMNTRLQMEYKIA